ncbi:hypothetical protein J6590_032470 [Homalodisca vitripennis]|nr:hypothetical protein J6590_032470 [Homalodisca vitripennis]
MPTRGLKTSPPSVPFKAVSDTGSSSGSGKKKEEVDLAMEVTTPETAQAKKEGIPPRKSPLRLLLIGKILTCGLLLIGVKSRRCMTCDCGFEFP